MAHKHNTKTHNYSSNTQMCLKPTNITLKHTIIFNFAKHQKNCRNIGKKIEAMNIKFWFHLLRAFPWWSRTKTSCALLKLYLSTSLPCFVQIVNQQSLKWVIFVSNIFLILSQISASVGVLTEFTVDHTFSFS